MWRWSRLGAGTEKNIAACSTATIGDGTPAGANRLAGRLDQPCGDAGHGDGPAGEFVGKVPLLVEGEGAVTVSVPAALRERVFLYYGKIVGRDGGPTTSFAAAHGYNKTEFRPCAGKPRTTWPGGLRIRGRPRSTWSSRAAKAPKRSTLRLGRPRRQPRAEVARG